MSEHSTRPATGQPGATIDVHPGGNGRPAVDPLAATLEEFVFLCEDNDTSKAMAKAGPFGLNTEIWPNRRRRGESRPDIKGRKVIVVAPGDKEAQARLRTRKSQCKKAGAARVDEWTLLGLGDEYPTLAEWLEEFNLYNTLLLDQPWLREPEPEPDKAEEVGAEGKAKAKAPGDGPLPANFTALITTKIFRTDVAGKEQVRYVIEARHRDGLERTVAVESRDFPSMLWVYQLGPEFAMDPGRDVKDHVRNAVQVNSHAAGIARIVEHTSMGWTKHDGADIYCHAGGVIAARPVAGVEVSACRQLSAYRLPVPTDDPATLGRCFKAHMEIENLAQNLTPGARAARAFLAALPWRAALKPFNTAGHLGGPSGNLKTSTCQVAVQHFSVEIKGRICSPPSSWRDTDNAILALLHHGKDCVVLVDDLKEDKDREKAERVLQAVGDLKGRSRMGRDQELLENLSPRGTMLSTGEIDPTTPSTLGRSLAAEIMLDDIDGTKLAVLQDAADAGLYATLMANYIRHVAGGRDAILARHAGLAADYRREIGPIDGAHPRHVEAIAELAAAYRIFLDWAAGSGLIAASDADERLAMIRADLLLLGQLQAPRQAEARPGRKFLDLIRSAMAAGRCHLTSVQSSVEPAARQEACGWHWEPGPKPGEGQYRPNPGSKRTGWIDEEEGLIYLDPQESKLIATEMLRAERNPQSFSSIGRELLQEKLVKAGTEGRPDQKKKIRGAQTRCYCIDIDQMFPD